MYPKFIPGIASLLILITGASTPAAGQLAPAPATAPTRQTLEKNLGLWKAEAERCQKQLEDIETQVNRKATGPSMPPPPATSSRLRTSSLQPSRLPGSGSLPEAPTASAAMAQQRKAVEARLAQAEQQIARLEAALGVSPAATPNGLPGVPPVPTENSTTKTAAAPRTAEELRFAALPVMKDEFVEPKLSVPRAEPSYADTIDFINSRLLFDEQIGFGKESSKIILRSPDQVRVFDPKVLSPAIKYVGDELNAGYYKVILSGRNGAEAFICQSAARIEPEKFSAIDIAASDRIDAEKLAKAFSHLIFMFGGKKEAF